MDNFEYINGVCPIGITVSMVGGKWKIAIIWQLRELETDGQMGTKAFKG